MYHVTHSVEHPNNKPKHTTPECESFFDGCFHRDPEERPDAQVCGIDLCALICIVRLLLLL